MITYTTEFRIQQGKVGSFSNSESEQLKIQAEIEAGYNKRYMTNFRVHQDELRKATLKFAGNKCCVTGITDPSFLIASHIKPWSVCSPNEMTDVHNALCLNVFHDKLFDGYRMTVNESMELIYDPKLKESIPEDLFVA